MRGQMMNAGRQLADAEEKVVILRAIKLRPKASRSFHDLPPDQW